MLVNRYDVSAVLQHYGVTIFVTPSGVDHGAVQSCLYHTVSRSRYVYGRMGGHIESIRHHAYKRGKEVYAFDREVTLDATSLEPEVSNPVALGIGHFCLPGKAPYENSL